MNQNAIDVKHLTYQTSNFELSDISFHVPKGYVTGFIGSNGAGKTTLIRLIMNLLSPDSGTIHMLGAKMPNFEKEIKEKIGFIYSELYLNEKWNITKCEKIFSLMYSTWDKALFEKYIAKFQLPLNKKIKTFSTGMKMKLSFAIAFSHHAELYILDEPTAGLDPVTRNEVLEIIQDELINEKKSVFFSTHIISDIEKIADHLVYLKNGEIIFDEQKHILLNKYQVIRGNIEDLDEELMSYIINLKIKQTGYEGLTREAEAFKELFGNRVVIKQPSIEELMVNIEQSGLDTIKLGDIL
ncbi:ABC transporter ATP-binding protein [Staphylococcus piscifermentans]|uniref:ABC transporter ATP-binding protein n=1 Tax=Staphylococcus piscifermentans TaxID=70258 RepID=A0A239TTZ0_9STAP|nr:ABC transporter ATP-binding protein [Staphylococcus piscifermentans]RTX83378.1 ABC transporter ATP-binding protein [Staphylococcus piscifermentans]GEP84665.1 ABC transporter ATP-binding protein [Staphylococcus piscifermentans]SNV01461.1 ABC transporter ATP-binding protein [Staphylococcus piscifermentans]